ncbi:MAG TPA: HAD-IIB family hydrolase [Terriglobia bacterium]|nr:HAD-IIB family hydrolase [Terriglobia bacterium]
MGKVTRRLEGRLKGRFKASTGGQTLIVFTDLDGTLLDHHTYRWTGAQPALEALAARRAPMIIVTSKTAAEVWPILRALGRSEPFVVENGGAIIFPSRYFPFAVRGARTTRRGWRKVELGTPRARLLKALERAAALARVHLRGFSQMSNGEVSRVTGLSRAQSLRAQRRECDEPFVILDRDSQSWARLRARIRRAGFQATRGSRFFHIHGENDKGGAVRVVLNLLRRRQLQASGGRDNTKIISVGLGDSSNDIPLLRAVDVAFVVARPGGRYDAETLAAVPRARRAGGIGPYGWNRAVLSLVTK